MLGIAANQGSGKIGCALVGLLVSLHVSLHGNPTPVDVKGAFIDGMISIGKDVEYLLVAQYPDSLVVVLPDSTFSFSPFEFVSKSYQPTRRHGSTLIDSVRYRLRSFSVDSVQYLKMRALVIDYADSSYYDLPIDSLHLQSLLAASGSDTLKLKSNVSHVLTPVRTNYPLYAILVGCILALLAGIILIYARGWIIDYKIRRIRKEYRSFIDEFGDIIDRIKAQAEPDLAEAAVTSWKRYMEKLERSPYRQLTTRELVRNAGVKQIEKPLKIIDRCTYGRILDEFLYKQFQLLEDFTQSRYLERVKKLRSTKRSGPGRFALSAAEPAVGN